MSSGESRGFYLAVDKRYCTFFFRKSKITAEILEVFKIRLDSVIYSTVHKS